MSKVENHLAAQVFVHNREQFLAQRLDVGFVKDLFLQQSRNCDSVDVLYVDAAI